MTPVGGQSQHTGRDFENNERVARDMGDGDWTILANGDWPSKDAVIAACSGSKNGSPAMEPWRRATVSVLYQRSWSVIWTAHPRHPLLRLLSKEVWFTETNRRTAMTLRKRFEYAKEQGATSCTVFGATGGDVQHEWANLSACGAADLTSPAWHPRQLFASSEQGKSIL